MLGAFKLKLLSKIISGSSDHPAVEPIGIIHADSFSSLGAFTQSGSIFSIVSNQLRMSTTAGNHTNYLRYTSSNPYRIHMLEKWKMSIKFTMPTAGGTTYGFGLGVLSNNSYGKFSNAMRIGLDTGGGVGKIYIYNNTNGTVGQQEITSTFTPTNGVQYIWEVERNKNQLIGRIKSSNGVTTHATYTHTYNITTTNSIRSHNRGEFVIYGYGGTITFDDLVIESSAQKNIKILALGDSNMYGLYSETNSRRYVEQACDALGYTFEICAGIDAGIPDLQAIIDQIIAMNPEYIYINILSNDLANGTSSGTFQGQFSTFISDLNSAGYDSSKIIIGISCARNGTSISSIKSYIDSNYSSYRRVDLYSITKNVGDTNLQSSLQIGDGIHMDEDGNDVCATPLQLAIEE